MSSVLLADQASCRFPSSKDSSQTTPNSLRVLHSAKEEPEMFRMDWSSGGILREKSARWERKPEVPRGPSNDGSRCVGNAEKLIWQIEIDSPIPNANACTYCWAHFGIEGVKLDPGGSTGTMRRRNG